MSSLKTEMLKQAMGFDGWRKLNSKEWPAILRALRISAGHGPINTKDADAVRGGMNVIGSGESEAKSE